MSPALVASRSAKSGENRGGEEAFPGVASLILRVQYSSTVWHSLFDFQETIKNDDEEM